MSVYSDYSADDRQVLRASLAAAAILVSASSPGRKEETVIDAGRERRSGGADPLRAVFDIRQTDEALMNVWTACGPAS